MKPVSGASISTNVGSFESNFVALEMMNDACSGFNLPSASKNFLKVSRFGFVLSSE